LNSQKAGIPKKSYRIYGTEPVTHTRSTKRKLFFAAFTLSCFTLKKTNKKILFSLTRIKFSIHSNYFKEFETLLKEIKEIGEIGEPEVKSPQSPYCLQSPREKEEENSDTSRSQKITTDVLLMLCNRAGITTAAADKTKIARLVSYLTGFSEEKIRQRLSNPDELTSYHKEEIQQINKIFSDLNCDISIKYNKRR
jgi:hypothetical protein